MTREEQIAHAKFSANPYSLTTDPNSVVAFEKGFVKGAEWADMTPKSANQREEVIAAIFEQTGIAEEDAKEIITKMKGGEFCGVSIV